MNILVISKTSIPALGKCIPDWTKLKGHGIRVTDKYYAGMQIPDVIVSMSVSVLEETFKICNIFRDIPLLTFCWDVYEWVWKNPRKGEYDYRLYGGLLARSNEIWVPSACTGLRINEWWGLPPEKIHVIKSSVPYFEHPVTKGNYVYCALREIPDRCWDWFERACKELSIPYKMTRHDVSRKEYEETLANCRLLVSHCYELSTGGLSLLEGYYLGKHCLINNSKYNGAKEYFGIRASYFGDREDKSNNYDYFKLALESNYHSPRQVAKDRKQWVIDNYSEEVMLNNIIKRIESCLQQK